MLQHAPFAAPKRPVRDVQTACPACPYGPYGALGPYPACRAPVSVKKTLGRDSHPGWPGEHAEWCLMHINFYAKVRKTN